MISKEHKKHADVVKPKGGKFHFYELGILGAPCGIIQKLAKQVKEVLPNLQISYVDADHGEGKDAPSYHAQYTDKIGFHEIQFHSQYVEYEFRYHLNNSDFTLVNGNHFKSDEQLVIINAKKKESLERKLDRLTNLKGFILDEGMEAPFDFLFEHNPDWEALPVFKLKETDKITGYIKEWYSQQIPAINGLVLAGGKSTRMGHDKSIIDYHGKPHSIFLAEMLSENCNQTFISKANELSHINGFKVIADSFHDLGPFGGILSAFRTNPNSAWLTVATDVPLLNRDALALLIQKRDPSKFATCFHNPETNFPEPLITIWEPRAYPRLLQFFSMGYSCPRKVLINSDIKEIHLENADVLANANTPEEMKVLKAVIANG